jgi:hypothetical protein
MMEGLKKNSISMFTAINVFEMTEVNIYNLSIQLFMLIVLLLAPLLVSIVTVSVLSKIVQDNGQIDLNWER